MCLLLHTLFMHHGEGVRINLRMEKWMKSHMGKNKSCSENETPTAETCKSKSRDVELSRSTKGNKLSTFESAKSHKLQIVHRLPMRRQRAQRSGAPYKNPTLTIWALAVFLGRLSPRALTSSTRPPAADGPSLCLCSRQGSHSVWRFIDARTPWARTCHRLLPLERGAGGGGMRVCLCAAARAPRP